ncbi:tRNA(Ile)-lysidine synthase [Posidoniimonas corsicana]|uniref:tRNA(Ile)-lysidine synthase n=1 Tax=Posidoniimonas corsicana TaxID=1938618 RepID=A0A5C5V7D5_9BACT|nr:tRNA lysidine(34) synthetase TilS [Posidoniimonas corsicana]TWT33642.1 tRNA(Ile)-lysidine synthase [Posidoniimonas corsicana]
MSPFLAAQVADDWPPAAWRDTHVLAAVSGGADSVAMLRALHFLKQQSGGRGQLMVAHFDHRLRGGASTADAEWVGRLADSLNLPFHLGEAAGQSLASEQQARDARYRWLTDTAHQVGTRYVATGHTADDQTETILHRLLRGSGLAGLAGIPSSRPLSEVCEVVRPLLSVSRAQVESFLGDLGQDFCTDATNEHADFTRNRLRNEVLPLLREQFGPSVDDAIRRAGEQASEAQAIVRSLAEDLALAAAEVTRVNRIELQPSPFHCQPPLIAREACKLAWRAAGWPEQAMGADEWRRLLALLSTPDAAAIQLPGGVDARWVGDRVELRRT